MLARYYNVFIAPACTMASEWQTPVARTLTRIWPSTGIFSSMSSKVRGALASLNRAALYVFGRFGAMMERVVEGCYGRPGDFLRWVLSGQEVMSSPLSTSFQRSISKQSVGSVDIGDYRTANAVARLLRADVSWPAVHGLRRFPRQTVVAAVF